MSEFIKINFSKIKYLGKSIGRDISVEFDVSGQKKKTERKINIGETQTVNENIVKISLPNNPFSLDVSLIITEKDFLFDDVGKKNGKIEIDPAKGWPQTFAFDVEVFENRSRIFKKGKKAIFTIELSADIAGVASGKIALYSDIDPYVKDAKLRKEPNDNGDPLALMPNGSQVEILKIGQKGNYPAGHFSDLWHEVSYDGQRGYAHSSVIEIEGQEREKIIRAIRGKAKELGIDEKLAVNLAFSESHWLPFAHGLKADDKGIYQLIPDTIKEINEKYGGSISDPYDPYQNIDGGLKYLKYLLEEYAGPANHLERTIAAWNSGPVPKSGDFNIRKYPLATQNLVENVLKNKLGEKIMKALGILSLTLLFGGPVLAAVPLLDYIGEDLSCDLHVLEKGNGVSLNDEKCDEIFYIAPEFFYSDRKDISMTKEEMKEATLRSDELVIKDKNGDNIYFFVTGTGFCGSIGCNYTLYQYNVGKRELKKLSDNIIGAIEDLQFSPSGEYLILLYDQGKCHPDGFLRVIDLRDGRVAEPDIEDEELYSNSIDNMRWVSDEKMAFSSEYTIGCYDMFDPNSWIARHREFIYDISEDVLYKGPVREERLPLDESAG